MPSQKLRPLHPRHSLRRLRTAFGLPSLVPTTSSTCSMSSPVSASTTCNSSRFSGFSFGNISTLSFHSTVNARRVIRRKKSLAEVEQEEERAQFDGALVSVVEPRPYAGPALGGIEEVLNGRI
ncbi:hypothetical protein M433DRAFT_140472 [Acidomyces richmondensis BFW]|nr:MAG: hypothetical protein FE78DRAFT_74279 [Acidomyces sp. 'richmondensis']KYG49025.1 hypothetical protein M433DRAFT_140472 [Acidomyces richmondensis BFW]